MLPEGWPLSMALGRASMSQYPSARQQVETHGAVKHQDKNKANPPSILLRNWQKACCLRSNKLRTGRSRYRVAILFQRVNWSGRQADYVHPSSAGDTPPLPPYFLLTRYFIKHKGQFLIFTFTNTALHLLHGAPRAINPLSFTFMWSFHSTRYELKHSYTVSCCALVIPSLSSAAI